jgi:TonB dependent receptor
VGYKISERWNASLSVFNLLDARASDIDYFYTSRLPGEPASGVADIHTHPAEPREIRISLTRQF